MGFGISDEVLEKIIMEPWLAPYRNSNSASTYVKKKKTYMAKVNTNYAKSILPKKEIETISNPTIQEIENVRFVKLIIKEIEGIYTKEIYSRFRSRELKQCFENIREYFESTSRGMGIDIGKDYTISRDRKSVEYLFQGISEQVFYIITHDNLTRKALSNVITDVTSIMNEWNLNKTGETVEKKIFFKYYEKRFGLIENEFRCCPYCGKVLYRGLYNCPNCLRIVVSENTQGEATSQVEVDDRNKQVFTIQQELEIANDAIKVLSDKITRQQEHYEGEHEALKWEIEKLLALVKEKDLAIEAYKQHMRDLPKKDSSIGKILVIGDNHLPKNELEEICYSVNLPFDKMEFLMDYSKIKGNLGKIMDSEKYEAIVIGAVPHKAKGIGNTNSPVEALKKKFYVVEAKTFAGELKITRDTLRKSLADVYNYMFTRGLI